jgi:hypothetical protein
VRGTRAFSIISDRALEVECVTAVTQVPASQGPITSGGRSSRGKTLAAVPPLGFPRAAFYTLGLGGRRSGAVGPPPAGAKFPFRRLSPQGPGPDAKPSRPPSRSPGRVKHGPPPEKSSRRRCAPVAVERPPRDFHVK